MAKKVIGEIKLQVPAGKANPAPPIGPALSQKGLNIMEFCKAFNAKTQSMEAGMPIPVVITAYADRTFTFILKQPPTSYFIKKALGLQKGSSATGRDKPVATITPEQIKKIATEKIQDMNAHTPEAAYQMVRGSAVSMGINIAEGA
ncbi:50S ribosomal protein L11 [Candidatus Hepatobacter penaei]|uniref:50S ribosomal protein L11 n=1 Tax=Candidatus Hepatobacter penaei TaxID=1274402 RepID=UPI0004F33BFD|nr:50S ribosomal protein L11 [Candidatus Hepatobacter penaei]TGW15350.1 50S ribosomal protein L11 [bacterium NHP-B]